MAELLHQSIETHPNEQVDCKETLVGALDGRLERYLQLLDQYQTLQQQLTQVLSRGYLQLAQANFSNPNRVRYGQEHWDDRMQASIRVFIGQSPPCFSSPKPRAREIDSIFNGDDIDDNFDTVKDSAMTDKIRPPPKGTETGSNVTRDPLNWFGILVPPSLRTSQINFKDAVADLIPALANTSKEMREVEIEVRKIRKRWRKAF